MAAWQQILFSTGGTLVTILWWVLGLLVLGGIIFFILLIKKFDNVCIVREIVQGRERVTVDKARLKQDKDGAYWWQLKKEKVKDKKLLPPPPEKALDITKKGKLIAECWRYPSGHVEWIESDHKTGNIDYTVEKNEKGEEIDVSLHRKSFIPINNNDRAVIVNQHLKAEQNRRKTWKEMILPLAYITSLTIIIIAGMIFFDNVATPVIEAKDRDVQQLKILSDMQQRQQQMEQNIQNIGGDINEDAPI